MSDSTYAHDKPLVWLSGVRVRDRGRDWRIAYHVADDAVVILAVFAKRSRATPGPVIRACRERLARYRREERC
jgi:phage-related protein